MLLGEFRSRASQEPRIFYPRIISTHLALNLHSPNLCLQGRREGVARSHSGHCARASLLGLGKAGRLRGPQGPSEFEAPGFLKVTADKKEEELLPAKKRRPCFHLGWIASLLGQERRSVLS